MDTSKPSRRFMRKPRVLVGTFVGSIAAYIVFFYHYTHEQDDDGTRAPCTVMRSRPDSASHADARARLYNAIAHRGREGMVWDARRRSVRQGLSERLVWRDAMRQGSVLLVARLVRKW